LKPTKRSGLDILLVEDDPRDVEMIVRHVALGSSRDRVLTVASLAQAESYLRSTRPDVVLLALRLPDGLGLGCFEAVRSCAPEVPVVVLLGLDGDELGEACVAAGAQDYLWKAEIDSHNLRRSISLAIARNKAALVHLRSNELQQHLAAIVEASGDAILSSTRDGTITSWNGAAASILGYPRDEAVGQPLLKVMRTADADARRKQRIVVDRTLSGDAPAETQEVVRLRKNGSPVWLSIATRGIRDQSGNVVGLAAICRDITLRKHRDEQLRDRHEQLTIGDHQRRALTVRLHSVREEERTRIARDVHDDLGHLLIGLKMDLRWIAGRLSLGTASAAVILERLASAEKFADLTIARVQRIAVELRPSALDALGLAAALRDEASRFEERTGVATLVLAHESSRPTSETSTALFRILQELMANVARHAKASSLTVIFSKHDAEWLMEVSDDGIGIPDGAEHGKASLGLLGMRERAEGLGGTVAVERRPRGGTVATVRIPNYEAEEPQSR
jgi:two-component system, NarL family, sensor histidine kinase UhpB